jgi:hypothetical protein
MELCGGLIFMKIEQDETFSRMDHTKMKRKKIIKLNFQISNKLQVPKNN